MCTVLPSTMHCTLHMCQQVLIWSSAHLLANRCDCDTSARPVTVQGAGRVSDQWQCPHTRHCAQQTHHTTQRTSTMQPWSCTSTHNLRVLSTTPGNTSRHMAWPQAAVQANSTHRHTTPSWRLRPEQDQGRTEHSVQSLKGTRAAEACRSSAPVEQCSADSTHFSPQLITPGGNTATGGGGGNTPRHTITTFEPEYTPHNVAQCSAHKLHVAAVSTSHAWVWSPTKQHMCVCVVLTSGPVTRGCAVTQSHAHVWG